MKLKDLYMYQEIVIQCHDNPDPDSLASAFALFTYFEAKGKHVRIIYGGKLHIQKSNISIMIETFNIPVEHVTQLSSEPELLITVDCQYGAGNVQKFFAKNVAIIDHHQIEIDNIPLSEIRSNYGSCSTLVWQLLQEDGFDINSNIVVSTALYYGLFTDTNQLSEISHPIDKDMRDLLHYDKSTILLLKNSNLSLSELEIAGIALIRYLYNEAKRFAVIKAQPCDPNILGLISDLVLQVDGIDNCVVYNEQLDKLKLSVRSCIKEVRASELVQFLTQGIGSGGGHIEKAGGYISKHLFEEKYKNTHYDEFFLERLRSYYESYTVIYAKTYEIDTSDMKLYAKRSLPLGYVKLSEIMQPGLPVTVRTLEGDLDILVSEDIYIMIGIDGEVYPIMKSKFETSYNTIDGEFILQAQYQPSIIDRVSGRIIGLIKHAKSCVSTGESIIYARPLNLNTKVFTAWDDSKYMYGKSGDILAVRSEDMHDIYIIERSIFERTYLEV